MDKLIEEMAKKAYENTLAPEPRSWATCLPSIRDCYIAEAMDMLSVIRKNVHLVAEPCTCFKFYYADFEADKNCKKCKGHGVLAREEK